MGTISLRERAERELAAARDLFHAARARGIPDDEMLALVGLGRELKETVGELDFVETKLDKDAVLYRLHLITEDIARWAAGRRLPAHEPLRDLRPPPFANPRGALKEEVALSDRCRFSLMRAPAPARELAVRVMEGGPGRAKASQLLAEVTCRASGLPAPAVKVLERPRAHSLRQGKLAMEIHGDYRPAESAPTVIRIYNRTARKEQEVAGKTFLDTLVHELCHHADFRILGLRLSPHCEGFYARIGHMVRSLRGIPLTSRPESYRSPSRRG